MNCPIPPRAALNYEEFREGLVDFGLEMTEEEQDECCRIFDANGDGTVDIDEFLLKLRPPMNAARKALVAKAWAKLDSNGDGVLTVMDFEKLYDYKEHPKYVTGEWTPKQVFENFMKTFDSPTDPDGVITLEEFVLYYTGVSSNIDNDLYFDLMMRKAYKLSS